MHKNRVIILNDTDVDGQHFGCQRVMRIIRESLQQRGMNIAGTLPVGIEMKPNHSNLTLFNTADVVVINGEGTLHHGRRKGRWLLDAAKYFKSHGKKVFLINALWQDNPADWHALLGNFDKIWCRDSFSSLQLSAFLNQPISWHGDLSLYSEKIPNFDKVRKGTIIGDSVSKSLTKKLWKFQAKYCPEAKIVPILKGAKFISPHLSPVSKGVQQWLNSRFRTSNLNKFSNLHYAQNENEYLDIISNSALSITGRFHAISLAILSGTPFVGVESNSHKISALVNDIGISSNRLIENTNLHKEIIENKWAYSEDEKNNIIRKLRDWKIATEIMFDEITERHT